MTLRKRLDKLYDDLNLIDNEIRESKGFKTDHNIKQSAFAIGRSAHEIYNVYGYLFDDQPTSFKIEEERKQHEFEKKPWKKRKCIACNGTGSVMKSDCHYSSWKESCDRCSSSGIEKYK
jgi:excinuclease UvrABC ATPase subunit